MLNRRRLLGGVLAVLLVSGVAGAQTATAVSQKKELTIYIGPQTKDGFIDTDGDIVDSIKDIKSVFRKRIKHVRIVDAPEKALLLLYVI